MSDRKDELTVLRSGTTRAAHPGATVLVVGGAGYIGAHTVRALQRAGYSPVVLDDLSSGHRRAVPDAVPLEVVSLLEQPAVGEVLRRYRPTAVIHFAAFIEAGESMTDPARFYRNNVEGSLRLLEAMRQEGISRLVFSSSAGVYGEVPPGPIAETAPTHPVSCYGRTKRMVEEILCDYDRAYGLRSISLRYFNACGADPSGDLGEAHRTKSHLIELALLTLLGQHPELKVFGTDYPTPDGTAIRDYIHVCDLADAHLLALDALEQGAASDVYNVGIGVGFSVKQVLDMVESVTGRHLEPRLCGRRAGDPAELVADSSRIRAVLGWTPRHPDLRTMIETAWRWHSSHPLGFV